MVSYSQQNVPVNKLAAKVKAEPMIYDFDVDEFPIECSTPLQDICVIAPLKPKEKTAGGIILAPTTTEIGDYIAQFGRIERVGEFFYETGAFKEAKVKPKVGDYVQFVPYNGRRFDVKGAKFFLLTSKDILQIINPEFTSGLQAYS